MGQIDRHSHNIMFRKNIQTGKIDLAPVYDYGCSYYMPTYYNNPFIFIRYNTLSLKSLLLKYPEISQYIEILSNISIDKVIADIEHSNGIHVMDEIIEHYYVCLDKEYNRVLKRL